MAAGGLRVVLQEELEGSLETPPVEGGACATKEVVDAMPGR